MAPAEKFSSPQVVFAKNLRVCKIKFSQSHSRLPNKHMEWNRHILSKIRGLMHQNQDKYAIPIQVTLQKARQNFPGVCNCLCNKIWDRAKNICARPYVWWKTKIVKMHNLATFTLIDARNRTTTVNYMLFLPVWHLIKI